MKKVIYLLFSISVLVLLTSCSNKKEDLQPVSIGNLAFQYDANVWAPSENYSETAPLEFSDAKGNIVSVNVSQESTYQHPMEMIGFFQSMISSFDEYEVFLEPKEVTVNGTTWYEFGYSYKDGTTIRKVYQRYYGKYYNAASISYTSTKKNFEAGYEEVIKMMSDIVTTEVTNDVNEAKAQEFLVGEWEVVGRGTLVLKEDGTYEWFKDTAKDKSNMHYGTYGCDVENASMSLKEGDGLYLVLLPEGLIIDGDSKETANYKYDYIISFEKSENEGYQMVNMSSYDLYTIIKQ